MTTTFVLEPLVGIGAVRLGASRESVLAALGTPEDSFFKTPASVYPTDAWFGSGLQVFYGGPQRTVDFIELSNDSSIHATLFGLAVFTTPVPVLISEIARRAALDETDPELGYSYIFPGLELAFWRSDDDDEATPRFATVGIGVPGYLSE